MSAAEIIEQIKTLPRDDRQKVAEFVKQLEVMSSGATAKHREKFAAAANTVFAKHREALEKLAQ